MNIVIDSEFLSKPPAIKSLTSNAETTVWQTDLNYIQTIGRFVPEDEKSFKETQSRLKALRDLTGDRILHDPIFDLGVEHGLFTDTDFDWHIKKSVESILAAGDALGCFKPVIHHKEGVVYRFTHEQLEMFREETAISKSAILECLARFIAIHNPEAVDENSIDFTVMPDAGFENLRKEISSAGFEKSVIENYLKFCFDLAYLPDELYKQARPILSFFTKAVKGLALYYLSSAAKRISEESIIDVSHVKYIHESGWALATENKELIDILELGGVPQEKYLVS